jgi:prepilin-type N-terminal cleavage/methylation domain-containing protein
MRARVRKAFTLVEILIVVVILGILAAIVVPQFTNATQDAQAGNVQTQLDTINNQIELFAARNNGVYPDFANQGWQELVTGGYLKTEPVNPACPGTTAQRQAIAIGAPQANTGWNWEAISATNPTLVMKASYFDEVNGVVTPGTP